jgi:hypothetical protein
LSASCCCEFCVTAAPSWSCAARFLAMVSPRRRLTSVIKAWFALMGVA